MFKSVSGTLFDSPTGRMGWSLVSWTIANHPEQLLSLLASTCSKAISRSAAMPWDR